ncbi:MAG TPA: undecaprenyl-phosphate glucose phosphotransferase [Anaerolineae bacterium]|nr:undecaprenyl-phosphate glucose phosphotransferase [Anaerolineae bacterium]HQH39233.1 undecaprenyl-phosphate glucose phosphotransferase [Anaerolineae bacterium]
MDAKRRNAAPAWVIVLDVAMINLSMGLAYLLRYRLQWFVDVIFDAPFRAYLPFCALFSVVTPLILSLGKSYSHWRGRAWLDQVFQIAMAVATALVIALAAAFAFRPLIYSRLLLLEAGFFMIALISLGRGVALMIQAHLRRQGIGVRRTVIVGAGEVGRRVMRTLVARPDLGYRIVGYVDDNPDKGEGGIGRIKGLGDLDKLPAIIASENVDEVIITLPWNYQRRILNILRECERQQVTARLVPDLFQMSLSRVEVSDLGGVPLIEVQEIAFSPVALVTKRIMDLFVAGLGLLLGWPILMLIALAIKRDSPGPVLFKQERVGKNHQRFTIYKFRSMRVGAEDELESLREALESDEITFKMRDDPRVTRVGRFLRRFSLDELPQLINVLKGDMSMVGPRPPIPAEVEQYQPWHLKRLTVPPGLTGLWQVSGRSELTFDEMVLLDLYYIEHWSPWLDVAIMLRTVPNALLGIGAY